MDDFLNEKYIDRKSITSYENSEVVISLFFAFFDLLIIITSSFDLKSESRNITILKSKVIKLFLIDIIVRILYIRKYNKLNIYKEILLIVFNTSQFYIVISFLDQVLYHRRITQLRKSQDKSKRIKLCKFFAAITISYDKLVFPQTIKPFNIIKIDKYIIIIQSIIALYCITKLYKYLKIKLGEIGKKIINETQKRNKLYLIVLGSPLSCSIFFSIYYGLRICFMFIKRPVIFIYANIILNIIKDSSKYFTFFVCEIIIYLLNKIQIKKEKYNKRRHYIDERDIINL